MVWSFQLGFRHKRRNGDFLMKRLFLYILTKIVTFRLWLMGDRCPACLRKTHKAYEDYGVMSGFWYCKYCSAWWHEECRDSVTCAKTNRVMTINGKEVK